MKKYILITLTLLSVSNAITLNEIINIAEKNNPILQEKYIEIKIQKAKIKQTKAKKFGEIDIFGLYNRYEGPRILYPLSPPINPQTLVGAENQFIVGVSYSVPIFTGFQIERSIEITNLREKLKRIQYSLTKNQIIYSIKSLYLKILSLQKQKEALSKYKQSLEQLSKNIQEEVKLGKKPEVDLLKVEYNLKNVEATIDKIRNSINSLKSALRTLAGKENLDLSKIEDIKPTNRDYLSRKNFIYKINQLDIIKQVKILEEISKKKIKIVKGENFPKIYFNASTQRNMGNGNYKNLWQVSLTVKYNLIDFGKRNNEYIQTNLELEKVKIQKKIVKFEILQKIDEAINQIKTAQSKIEATKKQVKFAKEVEEIEKAKYEEGVSDLYDYLHAKSQKVSAESSYYQALYDKEMAISYLEYILEEYKDE